MWHNMSQPSHTQFKMKIHNIVYLFIELQEYVHPSTLQDVVSKQITSILQAYEAIEVSLDHACWSFSILDLLCLFIISRT